MTAFLKARVNLGCADGGGGGAAVGSAAQSRGGRRGRRMCGTTGPLVCFVPAPAMHMTAGAVVSVTRDVWCADVVTDQAGVGLGGRAAATVWDGWSSDWHTHYLFAVSSTVFSVGK